MTATIPADAVSTCPLCHAPGSTLDAGRDAWRCTVCHQQWDAKRLATVAAYADFCAQRAAKTTV